MRSNIRKILDKEDGFTLVELLAVIVILGIIVAIAIPAIGSVIGRAETDSEDAEIALVEDAARLYVTTNQDLTWDLEDKVIFPISDGGAYSNPSLYGAGFLEDRAGEEQLKGIVTVTRTPISGEENTFTYEYEVELK